MCRIARSSPARVGPPQVHRQSSESAPMDLLHALFIVVACAVATALTWAACRWWYGKKLHAVAQRLHKSDQSRLFSQQQTLQAKKQIEALKKELEEQRLALQDTESSRKRTRDLEVALAAAESAAERAAGL